MRADMLDACRGVAPQPKKAPTLGDLVARRDTEELRRIEKARFWEADAAHRKLIEAEQATWAARTAHRRLREAHQEAVQALNAAYAAKPLPAETEDCP